MEDIDKKTQLMDLYFELSNLRQEKTKDIVEFFSKVDILSKKLVGSQVDIGLATT